MGSFIAKQPNGKYCRFSTVVECPTHINMTFEDYVKILIERGFQEQEAREEAKDVFDNYIRPFQDVLDRFIPNNMSKSEFNKHVDKMKDKNGKYEKTKDECYY